MRTAAARGRLGYHGEGFGLDPRLWRALVRVAQRQLRPGPRAWLRGRWLDLQLWWLIWTRRAHPDRQRLVRLMRSCRVLSELDPTVGSGGAAAPGGLRSVTPPIRGWIAGGEDRRAPAG